MLTLPLFYFNDICSLKFSGLVTIDKPLNLELSYLDSTIPQSQLYPPRQNWSSQASFILGVSMCLLPGVSWGSFPKLNPKAVTSPGLALSCKHDPYGPEVLSLSSQGHKWLIGFSTPISTQQTDHYRWVLPPLKIPCWVLQWTEVMSMCLLPPWVVKPYREWTIGLPSSVKYRIWHIKIVHKCLQNGKGDWWVVDGWEGRLLNR